MDALPTLTDALNARQDEYRYLLLDPLKKVATWNPLHAEQLRDSQGSDALRRILRPDLAWSPEHCPLLLLLASPGEIPDEDLLQSSEVYSRSEALHEKRYVCGWLSSKLPPDEMVIWQADLCKQIKPSACIPIFEPLRLELLQVTADPKLLSGQLAAVSQWHLMSCSGELKILNGQHSDDSWVLNWGAEQVQNDIRNIWRLLSSWHEASAILPADASRQAVDAWASSGKMGLLHLSDRLYMALNTLTQPTDITRHSAVQARLQQASGDVALYFEQLMQTLPEIVWQELSHA